MFYDPADRDDLCLDPRRIAQMADAFSRALDVDPRASPARPGVRLWVPFRSLERGWRRGARDLAIAAAIKQVRQTSY
ncbi:aminoglycoside phosphotransferase family protein [Citrobacter sedlakii]|uniref:aminoglycoside phosphotransferase family protein n=1 Tax=Citrobacter sedlakii TaxID=67826 RepID=UPI00389068D0